MYYLTHSWCKKQVHAFPKNINPKVNVIVWLDFELYYNDIIVQFYTRGIPHKKSTVFHTIFCLYNKVGDHSALYSTLNSSLIIWPSILYISIMQGECNQVSWGCRIHWLHLCRGVRLTNEYSGYDINQSDGKVQVMLELWGMQSTPSLPSLPGSL